MGLDDKDRCISAITNEYISEDIKWKVAWFFSEAAATSNAKIIGLEKFPFKHTIEMDKKGDNDKKSLYISHYIPQRGPNDAEKKIEEEASIKILNVRGREQKKISS